MDMFDMIEKNVAEMVLNELEHIRSVLDMDRIDNSYIEVRIKYWERKVKENEI